MLGWPRSRSSALRAEGGEIMARLLAFFQAFPKSGSFSPSFSKESLGGFVLISTGCKPPNPIMTFSPNFSQLPPTFRPIAAAHRAVFGRCPGAIALQRVVSRSWKWADPECSGILNLARF